MRAAGFAVAASLILAAPALAQKSDRPPPAPTEAGPSATTPHTQIHIGGEVVIGERAPDFELDASNGRSVRLSSLRGDWVVLLFDSRKENVSSLRKVNDDFRSMGAQVVGVCDEKAYHLESFAKKEQFPYLLLADPTGEISAMYGLYDGDTTEPGFVLLDRDGVVRMALLGQRLPPDDILRLIHFAVVGI